ncbi:MAG: HTH-type transcriptional regulator Ptr1 [Candidatus Thorarchaeota archaeon]|nr:MAG: HTH-type transcriptional regulator Ptr1 [Candidatus Thorarchaeota archaeon]
MGSTQQLDAKDRKIIAILQEDSRRSLRDIAADKEVDLSPSSVRNRIARLEEDGFIRKFTIDIDYRKMGYEIQVVALITSKPGSSDKLFKKLQDFHQIDNVYCTAGPANFICLIRVEDMVNLSGFITTRLEVLDGIEKIETLFIIPRAE